MSEQRPDTDERDERAGTPSPGPDDLFAGPATPGTDDAGEATAVPGAYETDEDEGARGRERKPGN